MFSASTKCEKLLEGSLMSEKSWRKFSLAENIVSILKAAIAILLPLQAYQSQSDKNQSRNLLPDHPK
jgi:hypothetical protein